MAHNSSFEQILREQMGIKSNSPFEAPLREEEQALWVQVLPFLPKEKWEFRKPSPYKNKPASRTEIKVEAPTPPQPKPLPPEQKLIVSELNGVAYAELEILIRGGWLPRQEVYTASEWKKAHRKAVKALHPDQNDASKQRLFTEVHEGFKNLRAQFKTV